MATALDAVTTLIKDIPLSRLRVAPWNARKTYNEGSLLELTDSVKQRGVQVPLIVRPIDADQGGDIYEIVAGERRSRAAAAALLPFAPCIVRMLTDGEAREVGMTDNLQRENLPPLDEARGFAEMMQLPGATIESVATKVGKEPSYVGRRLRLLDAIEPVQAALAAGAIEVGHALELARLDPKQQARLVNWLRVAEQALPDEDENDFEDEDSSDDEDDQNDKEGEEGDCMFFGPLIARAKVHCLRDYWKIASRGRHADLLHYMKRRCESFRARG